MKLKIYNPDNAGAAGRSAKPNIAFSANGLIAFNKAAVQALNLKEGDLVEFAEDEENDGDWYFKIVPEGGFSLKAYKDDGRLCFNSSKIVMFITEPLGLTKALCPIAKEATDQGYYAILTAGIKSKD